MSLLDRNSITRIFHSSFVIQRYQREDYLILIDLVSGLVPAPGLSSCSTLVLKEKNKGSKGENYGLRDVYGCVLVVSKGKFLSRLKSCF